jgi:hypothetical protein
MSAAASIAAAANPNAAMIPSPRVLITSPS